MAHPSSFVLTRSKAEVGIEIAPSKLQSYLDRKVSLGLAPISGTNVGAVGIVASKEFVYLGVNVELPGLPLNHSIHAVQFLVTNLALNSERNLDYVAVSSDGSVCIPPCDRCYRFLQELRAPDIKILIENKDEISCFESLLRLPGNYYGLLDERKNELTLLDPHADNDDDLHLYYLKSMGLAAANKSYAPYSKCPSGVALRDSDDQMYRGWYMELVACNSSLGPLQAALVDFVTRTGGNRFEKIIEVVLVEKKYPKVRQEDTVRMILKKIARSDFSLRVFHCSEPENM